MGSAALPLAPVDAMILMTSSFGSVRAVQFANRSGYAQSAITLATEQQDSIPTVLERNLFTTFADFAIRRVSGRQGRIWNNGFISNGGAYTADADGVNDDVARNYSAGGPGYRWCGFATGPRV